MHYPRCLFAELLDNLIIQTSHQRSAPYTNLYTRTKRCYWLDSTIFSQPEFRNLSTPIKKPIECIQIQTGSLVYIFNCLMRSLSNRFIHFIIKDFHRWILEILSEWFWKRKGRERLRIVYTVFLSSHIFCPFILFYASIK